MASFSGKAALIKDKRDARKEQVEQKRCTQVYKVYEKGEQKDALCGVPIMADTVVKYCRIEGCPHIKK